MKYFIIYDWESENLTGNISNLYRFLISKGINVHYDKSEAKKSSAYDFDVMMHKIFTDYDKIIVALSKSYKQRAENFIGGVGREYQLLIKHIEDNPNKYLIIRFNSDDLKEITPLALKGRKCYDLSNKSEHNSFMSILKPDSEFYNNRIGNTLNDTILSKGFNDFSKHDGDSLEYSKIEDEVNSLISVSKKSITRKGALLSYKDAILFLKDKKDNALVFPLIIKVSRNYIIQFHDINTRLAEFGKLFRQINNCNLEEEYDVNFFIEAKSLYSEFRRNECYDGSNQDYINSLHTYRKLVDKKLKIDFYNNFLKANLLVCKSFVLRLLSELELSTEKVNLTLDKSYRCCLASLKLHVTWFGLLEKAILEGLLMKKSISRINFYKTQFRIESLLWDSINLCARPANLIALCSHYRYNYRAPQFFVIFNFYESIENNSARFINTLNYFFEVVIQLFYDDRKSDLFLKNKDRALKYIDIVEKFKGYSSRLMINISFIHSINGDHKVGRDFISLLQKIKFDDRSFTSTKIDWNHLANNMNIYRESDDELLNALLFGIQESTVWSKMGTFATTFLNDYDTAKVLYERALSISKSNYVALTNLAKLHFDQRFISDDEIDLAKTYIHKASVYSSANFQWWRKVKKSIDDSQSQRNLAIESYRFKNRRINEIINGLSVIRDNPMLPGAASFFNNVSNGCIDQMESDPYYLYDNWDVVFGEDLNNFFVKEDYFFYVSLLADDAINSLSNITNYNVVIFTSHHEVSKFMSLITLNLNQSYIFITDKDIYNYYCGGKPIKDLILSASMLNKVNLIG